MNSLCIGFVPLGRPTFDTVLAGEVAAQARRALAAAGCKLVGPEALVMDAAAIQAATDMLRDEPLDLLLVFQATFADSTMVVELAEAIGAPLLLWAVPEARTGGRLRLNSLCGINLGAHSLARAGLRYDYVYAAPEDAAALVKTLTLARAGRVRRLLRTARVGRVGQHPDGFEPCSYDADVLAARLGVQIVPHELAGLFADVRALSPSDTAPALEGLRATVDGLDALDQGALHGTLGVYTALRRLAAGENLSGLAVRCWPEFFTELGCAACGAMSMLTDALTPCSCEADVNGTVTQLILQWLSGEQAFGTDVVGFDLARDEAVVWHCGLAPLAMADPAVQPRGTIHSNRKLPLLMEFPLEARPRDHRPADTVRRRRVPAGRRGRRDAARADELHRHVGRATVRSARRRCARHHHARGARSPHLVDVRRLCERAGGPGRHVGAARPAADVKGGDCWQYRWFSLGCRP